MLGAIIVCGKIPPDSSELGSFIDLKKQVMNLAGSTRKNSKASMLQKHAYNCEVGGKWLVARSRSKDSGVRREGREQEKNKEEKGERERGVPSLSLPTPPPRCYFCLLTTLCAVPAIWTSGTG